MTPGARAAAAVELLTEIDTDRTRPADAVVAGWFRKRRYAGGGDRRVIQTVLYTVLRHRAQIDWWLAKAQSPQNSRTRVIAALLLGEDWSRSDLESAFDGGKYRPAPLDANERDLAAFLAGRTFDDPEQPIHVRANIPAWIESGLEASLGDSLEAELAALMQEASVDLRVNSLKATRDSVAEMLAASGIQSVHTHFSPLGLRLPSRVNLAGSPVYRDGLAELQDESSQIAAILTGARAGENVVDFCAGAGGKTLALAAMMENQGRVVACDTSGSRLARAIPRLERAGVTIVETRILEAPDGLWTDAEPGSYDCVLVDAPCSGTGTWRRHPEARWRMESKDLTYFTALQEQILGTASRLVAPGGRLVYAVCSLLPEEGEGVVTAFLGDNDGFHAEPVRNSWKAAKLQSDCPAGDMFLRLRPGRDGTDGFFIAILTRDAGTGMMVPVQ